MVAVQDAKKSQVGANFDGEGLVNATARENIVCYLPMQ